MKRSSFSEEQIIAMLKEQEAGMPTADQPEARGEFCDVLQVEGQVWWAGGLGRPATEGARGRERQVKKLLAEAMLDNAILKDVAAKKW